ncbi:MAG: PEP-CTERM sorting domain-containing protein [Cyanobacteria bacterium J007]|nr:MAG: PEP-CTERM sorting domain-containing protein [Cyanobacteria bacterium J007]
MAGLLKNLLLSASVIAGVGAMASAPAFAASLSGASLSGTGSNTYGINPAADFEIWDYAPGSSSVLESYGTNTSNLLGVLGGTGSSPGGNVELFRSSEVGLNNSEFLNYDGVSSLDVSFDDGTSLTFSSLTAQDLFGSSLDTSYSGNTLAVQWFNDAWNANVGNVMTGVNNILAADPGLQMMANFVFGIGPTVDNESELFTILEFVGGSEYSSRENLFDAFYNAGGFQRTVDANIAYVKKDGDRVNWGLAGHADLLFYAPAEIQGLLSNAGISLQASELVKVNDEIFYTFAGVGSDVIGDDGISFNMTYEGGTTVAAAVPEPSVMLGLMAVGGLVAASKRRKAVKDA